MEKHISILMKNKEKITKMMIDGVDCNIIAKEFNVSVRSVVDNYMKIISIKKENIEIGYKKLEDFPSEEEMLNTIEYKYENLSDGEKEIYDNREKNGSLGKHFTYNDGLYGRH